MGTMANELSLGCDCLGQIHYLVRIYIVCQISPILMYHSLYSLVPMLPTTALQL
jgi:hypothetical protein